MTIQQVVKKSSENLLITQFELTELAPSLDDSVIALHREATISCCPYCGQLPAAPYEDSGLLCPHCSPVKKPYCYQCGNEVNYLFPDARCKDCTRLTFEEVV
jgi:hypothetical protein